MLGKRFGPRPLGKFNISVVLSTKQPFHRPTATNCLSLAQEWVTTRLSSRKRHDWATPILEESQWVDMGTASPLGDIVLSQASSARLLQAANPMVVQQ
jgi:hypothetical protein